LDNNGTTNYVKQFGGKANDEGLGVAIQTNNTPVVCGNYQEDLFFPFHPTITYSFGVQGLFNGGPHHYLSGDNSRNSFLSNAIGTGSEDINFFENTPIDSLFGNIIPDVDTLHFCQTQTLGYNPKTSTLFGPDYTYLWNTGATTPTISVNSTSTISLVVKRKDECVSGGDTIYTILHIAPPMPSKTDNILQAINEFPTYSNYQLCFPDSVQIWFNNLCAGCTIAIGPTITDTLPHYYTQSGNYAVSVTDAHCTNTQNFSVLITENLPYDSIVPYLYFPDDEDQNDTVVFCFGNNLSIHIYDSISNPTAIVGQFDTIPSVTMDMFSPTIICSSIGPRLYTCIPSTTGWYTFNYVITTGFDNYCGVDTIRYETSDSIYIIVNPLPTANSIVSGSSELCPNSTPFLTVSPVTTGFQWVGPDIIWQSLDNDSIQISGAGNYTYMGSLTDSITGCTNNYSSNLSISLLEPPLISSDPADGVVCLNDSITLTVPPNYASYNWEGPFGSNLSTTNNLITSLQGLYSCEVTNFQGCVLATLQFEVIEFSTPSLFVDPLTILCPNEQTSIYVIYDGNAQITWLNPMNNNAPIITVTQPDTYICQIQQCGLTFVDSVTILDGAFQPPITASDSLLCLGETATITTTAGFSEYLWSTGQTGVNSIPVTSSGIYSVLVTNAFGCVVSTSTVTVQEDVSVVTPNVIFDTLCAGSPLALSNPQNNILSWFNSDTVLIETSSLLFLNAIYTDTIFLAAYSSSNCPLNYQSIPIEVVENPTSFIHLDDSVLCLGEELLFTNPSVETSLDWFIADSLISTNGSFSLSFNSVPNTALILSAAYSNSCFTDTLNFPIQLISPPLFSLQLDTLVLCPGSQEIVNYSPNYPTIIWTFPNGDVDTLSALSLTNDAENGYLIATAIDPNGCQSVSDSALLLSSVTEIEILSNSLQPCINDTVELRVAPDSSPLTWTFPNGTFSSQNLLEIILSPNNTGLYIVRYIDPLNCPISDSFLLTGQPLPTVVIPEDTLVCVGSIFTLPEIAGSYYVWEQVGETTSFPVTVGGNYYLQTISANGCITYDTITLNTINCEDDLPNVITPNGDGINDFFYLEEATIFLNNQLVILNRWGLEIYNSKGYNNTFNGADVTDGVYFYSFTYDLSGKDPTVKRGFLTIIH
jgi:gliding motility-associated-like protein